MPPATVFSQGAHPSEDALRIDVPVERLPRDAQLPAQLADLGARLAHRRLRQPQLRHGHRPPPPPLAALGTGGGQARLGPLDNQLPLELRQGGEEADFWRNPLPCPKIV
jgi:hypothetical protein